MHEARYIPEFEGTHEAANNEAARTARKLAQDNESAWASMSIPIGEDESGVANLLDSMREGGCVSLEEQNRFTPAPHELLGARISIVDDDGYWREGTVSDAKAAMNTEGEIFRTYNITVTLDESL